jgi:hypothetical protein
MDLLRIHSQMIRIGAAISCFFISSSFSRRKKKQKRRREKNAIFAAGVLDCASPRLWLQRINPTLCYRSPIDIVSRKLSGQRPPFWAAVESPEDSFEDDKNWCSHFVFYFLFFFPAEKEAKTPPPTKRHVGGVGP